MLDTNLSILGDKLEKSFLVSRPGLHNILILVGIEASAKEDPVTEFAREAHRSADQLKFGQDRINFAAVLKDKGVQFWDRTL